MSSEVRGKGLTSLGAIVEQHQEKELQAEISKLTDDNKVKFKVVFCSQLETDYKFDDLQELTDSDSKAKLTDEEQLKLMRQLGHFIDRSVNKDISMMEGLFRRDDATDKKYDPVGGAHKQIRHLIVEGGKFRMHGYYNDEGYFVVIRLDWCHLYHLRQERSKNR